MALDGVIAKWFRSFLRSNPGCARCVGHRRALRRREFVQNVRAVINRTHLTFGNGGEEIGAAQIFIHPDYDPFQNDADIAVVILSRASTIEPIPYLDSNNLALAAPGTEGIALGWGTTR